MKLKIDNLKEFVQNIDYPMEDTLHSKETQPYFSKEIADSIIPFYLNTVCNKTFSERYKISPYACLRDKTCGFYLGIPYGKVEDVNIVCKAKEEALARESKALIKESKVLTDEFTDFEHNVISKISDLETEIQKQVVENRIKEEVEKLETVKRGIERIQSNLKFWDGRLSERWSNETKEQIVRLHSMQMYHQERIKNMPSICQKERVDLQNKIAYLQNELEERRKTFINAKREKING